MAKPRRVEHAVLFMGILASGLDTLAMGAEAVAERFGMPDCGCGPWAFSNTDYYRDELGERPLRAFLGWHGSFSTDGIAGVKILTNALELEIAEGVGGGLLRPVNLDPGYLTRAKLVLASAKNFSHRIHLRDGIYGEVTLLYRGKGFRVLPWTFPDFGSGRYDRFFLELRGVIPC